MTTPLFDSLEIRQFRAFDYIKIEQLGHINLFLGKNNVGKSTLLEALSLHANLGSPQTIQWILDGRDEPGEVRHGNTVDPTVWSLFHDHPALERIKESIQIGRAGAPDSALSLSIAWLRKVDEMDVSGGFGDGSGYGGGVQPGHQYVEVGPPDVTDGDGPIPSLVVKYGSMRRTLRLDEAYDDLCRRWNLQTRSHRDIATPCVHVGPGGLDDAVMRILWEQVVLTDAKQDVIDAMRIIAPETEDFALLHLHERVSSLRLRVKGRQDPVPIKTMGDGMNRLFGLGMALACAKDGILLVDEIENGIHWSVLPDVWKFVVKVAKRLNVQVFATTHSNDCLKAFQMGTKGDPNMDGVAVRIEKRNGEFSTEIFDERRLAVIVKEAIEIR
ncbi:MAG: AAA family ATPase [Magnetococcales bacterium]|nr:AAA family ATPase [Magnetococcales bacterium]